MQDKSKECESLKESLREAQGEAARAREEVNSLKSKLESRKAELGRLRSVLGSFQAEQEAKERAQSEVASLRERVAALGAELTSEQAKTEQLTCVAPSFTFPLSFLPFPFTRKKEADMDKEFWGHRKEKEAATKRAHEAEQEVQRLAEEASRLQEDAARARQQANEAAEGKVDRTEVASALEEHFRSGDDYHLARLCELAGVEHKEKPKRHPENLFHKAKAAPRKIAGAIVPGRRDQEGKDPSLGDLWVDFLMSNLEEQ